MILLNTGKVTVKRYEGGWIVCPPGATITVSKEAGEYLLRVESHIWTEVKEEKVPRQERPKRPARPRTSSNRSRKAKASETEKEGEE